MENAMKTLLHFLLLLAGAVIAIVIGVVVGDYGAWYFSWLIGTIMIVLFAAAGGVLYDTQENERDVPGH
jgi:FtsH-binding integral membrane protein